MPVRTWSQGLKQVPNSNLLLYQQWHNHVETISWSLGAPVFIAHFCVSSQFGVTGTCQGGNACRDPCSLSIQLGEAWCRLLTALQPCCWPQLFTAGQTQSILSTLQAKINSREILVVGERPQAIKKTSEISPALASRAFPCSSHLALGLCWPSAGGS